MIEVKYLGKRGIHNFAEWKDIKAIVNRHLKENKKFYEELAEL